MIKSSKKIGLNRDTLRKLDKGEMSQARGGYFNTSAGQCACSSHFGAGDTLLGPSRCPDSCD